MKESPRCLGCGDILPAGAGLRVCARCRDLDALSLTEPYRPGEQADDAKTVDHRADSYSLGCTIYFLAVGRPPFPGDSMIKKLMAHQNRPAPSLHAARTDVPATLEAAYQAMMAKNPADRPQSMTAVIWLLEGDRPSAPIRPRPRKGLITFVDGRPVASDSNEEGRGLAAISPARFRPGDGQPFDSNSGVYDVPVRVQAARVRRYRGRRSAGVQRRPGRPGWNRAGSISAAGDGPIVGAEASDLARFGQIDDAPGKPFRGSMPFCTLVCDS
jgi:hypothetical protein